MKLHVNFEGGNNPVLSIIPKSSSKASELRDLVQRLSIENPALTFAKEYRKYEHNEPSYFCNLSEEQIEQIASVADKLANLWKDSPEDGGSPEINIIKLLEKLLN